MPEHFQAEIAFVGIDNSPAFVRAPEGNGCAEQVIVFQKKIFRVRHFETITKLRQALLEFRELYNTTRLIARRVFMAWQPSDNHRFGPEGSPLSR